MPKSPARSKLHSVQCLTLSNLRPSDQDKAALLAHSKAQRLAHYNLFTILALTAESPEERQFFWKARDTFRLNTLDPKTNKCEFDLTDDEKKLASRPKTHDPK